MATFQTAPTVVADATDSTIVKYDSVLLRQNLQDTGTMPRTGGWTTSPDLIAGGTTPITDPQAKLGSATSYATDPTVPVVHNGANYIYLRGKNLDTVAVPAEARAFYAPQSLFLYPQQWLQNAMKTQRGADFSAITSIAPNAIGVTTDPLMWIPTDTYQHYCLVGFLSTAKHPFESQKPPNGVTSLDDLAAWIGKNGGTGWHNVQFTDTNAPTFTNSTVYPGSSTPARVQFAITCVDCPAGAQVSFSCGTPLPNGQYINLPVTTIPSPSQIGFVVEFDIPANWTSPISYSYYANGKPPAGQNFSVSMSAAIKETQAGKHAFSAFARPAHEVYPNHFAVDLKSSNLADMPVGRLVPVGSDTTLIKPS
jgi:hypothetical protein